jgi:hypothetical protein
VPSPICHATLLPLPFATHDSTSAFHLQQQLFMCRPQGCLLWCTAMAAVTLGSHTGQRSVIINPFNLCN